MATVPPQNGDKITSSYNAAGLDDRSNYRGQNLDDRLAESSTTYLVSLALKIANQTKIVDNYLQTSGNLYPTFEADGPTSFPKLPDEVQQARQNVLEATMELRDLMMGPAEMITSMAWDVSISVLYCGDGDGLGPKRPLSRKLIWECSFSIKYHFQS